MEERQTKSKRVTAWWIERYYERYSTVKLCAQTGELEISFESLLGAAATSLWLLVLSLNTRDP